MAVYEHPLQVTLSWVAAHCGPGASVVSTERLVGGITADVDRIVLRGRDGQQRHVVLRRWTTVESWTDGLVEREAAALHALEGRGIDAPQLLAVDPTGERAGVRCLLMTSLPGEVVLAPTNLGHWLSQLASVQARIHQVPSTLATTSAGWFDAQADFGWISDPGLRREALAAASAAALSEQTVFVHGDYQHFNVLWRGTEVSGVVDWTMAGTGPRGIDVGHCRLNLAVLFSTQAAETYLHHYEDESGVTVDPRADLRALLCWNPDWLRFIPTQISGRTRLDVNMMPERVIETVRRSLARIG